jgi:hypothetical protein
MTNLLFKEMVQNAEDAGAKCMKILYDNTNIEPGGTSNIRQYLKVSYYLAIRLLSMGEWGGVGSGTYDNTSRCECL